MEITLSDISRRIILRYYPIWFLLDLVRTSADYYMDWSRYGLVVSVATDQLGLIVIYVMVFSALRILKPTKFFSRLIIMGLVLITVVGIFYLMDSERFTYCQIPIFGPFSTENLWYWLLCGIYLIWFYFLTERSLIAERNLVKEQTRRILQEKKLAKNRLHLLQARVDPRFLFDTMESIADLLGKDMVKAKTMQSAFIQYLRATLVKTKHRTTTVEQEMGLIQSYLGIYKVRMGDRLNYDIDTDPDAKALTFPPMLILPIVENAVKHGLAPKIETVSIVIEVKKNEHLVQVIITSINHNMNAKKAVNAALPGLKERINILFGDEGKIFMKEDSPSGFQVHLILPYV